MRDRENSTQLATRRDSGEFRTQRPGLGQPDHVNLTRAEACLVVVQYLHQENAAFTFRTSLYFLEKSSESTKKLSPPADQKSRPPEEKKSTFPTCPSHRFASSPLLALQVVECLDSYCVVF